MRSNKMGLPVIDSSIKTEIFRKLLHLPLFIFVFLLNDHLKLTLILMALLVLFYLTLLYTPWLNFLPIHWIKKLQRKDNKDYGPIYLVVGILITWLLASNIGEVYGACSIVVFCDSVASVLGKLFPYGKINLFKKTIVGSLSFLSLTLLISSQFLNWPQACIASIILTLVELISLRGIDNLLLPPSFIVLLHYL